MNDGEMINRSAKQTEQKGTIEIIDLSDDENENIAGCTKMAPGMVGDSMKWMTSNGRDLEYESMFAEGEKNTQIVPYDQGAVLLNYLPLQTSWQPSIQYEKVVLQKKPEEARMQDIEVCTIRF